MGSALLKFFILITRKVHGFFNKIYYSGSYEYGSYSIYHISLKQTPVQKILSAIYTTFTNYMSLDFTTHYVIKLIWTEEVGPTTHQLSKLARVKESFINYSLRE